jgi:hypothetical protein
MEPAPSALAVHASQAPCITNVFLNYFLGTTCLPDKPIDVKPEEEEEGDRK